MSDELGSIEELVRRISEEVSGSVVSIGRNGRGTGFVIADGRVVTNAHNLRDRTASVTFGDGRVAQGAVHGADVDGDLAVLAVDTGGARPLELAAATPGVGAAVVAVGRGGHRTRASLGFVSAADQTFRGPRGRVITGSIEHTAPTARGSSGGPVLDRTGKVVAINTHRSGDGFYLARAVDSVLRTRLDDLLAGRSPERRMLGVAIAPSDVAAQLRRAVGLAERPGLLVRDVDDDGPAGRAGIQVGDLLVTAGERPLLTPDDLAEALDRSTGDSIDVAIVRGVDERTITVSFAAPSATTTTPDDTA